MTSVWIRLALYTLFPVLASLGFGGWDSETGTLTLSINEIAASLAAAAAATGLVFNKWGNK
jgi:acetylglutamate kinase